MLVDNGAPRAPVMDLKSVLCFVIHKRHKYPRIYLFKSLLMLVFFLNTNLYSSQTSAGNYKSSTNVKFYLFQFSVLSSEIYIQSYST